MSTKNKWLIGVGIVVGLIVLFALPFAWHALFPAQGYGMMGWIWQHAHAADRLWLFAHARRIWIWHVLHVADPACPAHLDRFEYRRLIKYLRTP